MNQKALLLWIGGFIGVGLLYAAYKGKLNPITAVSDALDGKPQPVGSSTTAGASGSPLAPGGSTYNDQVPAGSPVTAQPSGVVTSGLVQEGSVWYVTDQYGNPTTPVNGVYQGLPNNYIPNTGSVLA